MQDKICVIIPTYNNAGTILKVIQDVERYCPDIIVVNDGSDDDTYPILSNLKSITLVSYCRNRGKGYALKMGFMKALESGFGFAITIDADGQHSASDIPHFLELHTKYENALIVGSRNLCAENMPGKNSFANKFSNFWFKVQTLQSLPDTQSGYRLYPIKSLGFIKMLTSRYEAELALLVLAAWNRIKIIPININVYYPPQEERVTHFRPIYDFACISVLNTLLCFIAVLYWYPRMLIDKIFPKK